MITLCIFLAFPLNMANALEEKTDALEEKADALEEPLDSLEEQTEDIQEIETEKKDEEDEVIDSSAPEQENITEISEENPEYHRGDVQAINKMIENGSIKNLEYNNPESWASDGVRFYTEEHETGEGRRIEQIMIGVSSNCVLTGSIDLRKLKYLTMFELSNTPLGQPVHTVTEINADGLRRLQFFSLSYLAALTAVDISDTAIQMLGLNHLNNMTTLIMEDASISTILSFTVPNLKQFTNTNGNTLVIESNGPGGVIFESYNHTSQQFTLRSNPEMVIGTITGFSHWTATPNGVNYVSSTNQFSRTVTFSIRDDVDTTMTAWFEPEPNVGAPVIDKVTTTGASFSGTVQLFAPSLLEMGFEYRKKGEDEWIYAQFGAFISVGNGGNPLAEVEYSGSFDFFMLPTPIILQPATTYQLRVSITNSIGTNGRSDIVEFTTLSIVTIRHVESKGNDGSYTVLDVDDKIMHIHIGSEIEINAGEYPGLTGLHYRLMKHDDSGDIEDTIYALGTNLKIVDNTTIIVYHASTVVDVTFPTKMEFYAYYSDRGSVKSKEEYSFVNNSALPVMVNLKRYDVIEEDGINFVANAENDGDMHFSLLPTTTTINNNGFTTPITNIQPNTPLNRSLGTLGGYALGDNSVGGFTIGGKYVGIFYVQPRHPMLEFVFSFEIDWEKLE